MEGLADVPFRRALAATVGGFDEACTEFIRIPGAAPDTAAQMRKSAARLTEQAYDCRELGDTPLAAQIMGSLPDFLGVAAEHLATQLGAHRVDLNCGCPGARARAHVACEGPSCCSGVHSADCATLRRVAAQPTR
jgi:tRNA-dihydrouridine synthase C